MNEHDYVHYKCKKCGRVVDGDDVYYADGSTDIKMCGCRRHRAPIKKSERFKQILEDIEKLVLDKTNFKG